MEFIELWKQCVILKQKNDKKGITTSRQLLAKVFKISEPEARGIHFALNRMEFLTDDVSTINQIRESKASSKKSEKLINELYEKINDLSGKLSFYENIPQNIDVEKIKIEPSSKKKNEAVAISCLSDWHMEEGVEKNVVSGLNEYNPTIATKRMQNYFKNLVKLIKIQRQDTHIDTLVLAVLGDMMSGYIHEELKIINHLSPTETVLFVKEQLLKGIKTLAEDCKFTKIIIPCTPGNHGRNTEKKMCSIGYRNSYEYMMYIDMQTTCKLMGLNNVSFIIQESEYCYIDVFDKTLRFSHGDHFKFAGGVGGLQIPLMKWLMRINSLQDADMSYLGHWHQLIHPTNNCFINGSGIGYNGYAHSKLLPYEKPQQLFQLLDNKYGFTINTKVIIED
jgi:hypothetical protein